MTYESSVSPSSPPSVLRTVLRSTPGAPTLFLLDEFHHCDACTDDNARIADSLFSSGVCLVGVEGFEGGREWVYHNQQPQYSQRVVSDVVSRTTGISDYPRFAQKLLDLSRPVVGIDCAGLCDQVEVEMYEGTWLPSMGRHPNHHRRSLHFVGTLFAAATARRVSGDLLLNCGAEHNADIERIVRGPGPLPSDWLDWNYVRIRSPQFAACV